MTDRAPDVISLLWDNGDGTFSCEVTDYRSSPPERITRLFMADAPTMDACEALDQASVVVPDEAP